MIIDWDKAYDNSGAVLGSDAFGPKWEAEAAAYRDTASFTTISTGPHAREQMDIFWPEGTPKGLVFHIHGGYWRSREPRLWSHLALGAVSRGWAFAMPGYTLCPEVRIADITRQIQSALDVAAEQVPGPIRISGHSAGGHLAARMACEDVSLTCWDRVQRIVPISGVFDLRPLIHTAMNADFRMSLNDAEAESPALKPPKPGPSLVAWVGASELPEFVRQNALLANIWSPFLDTSAVNAPGDNHFTVIEGMANSDDPLTEVIAGD